MHTKFVLTLDEAGQALAAAQAEARRMGWRVTVAIVDDTGLPLLLSRMDDASPASPSTAVEKAKSAAQIGLPTRLLEDMVATRPGLLTMPGRVAVEGGLPILYRNQRVGGIGVSGVRSDQDAQVAQAGLDALGAVLAGDAGGEVPSRDSAAIQAIEALEQERCAALVRADWDRLAALLSDDLVHVHSSGLAEGRESYIANISSALEFISVERPSLAIRIHGDVAIVTGPLVQTVRVRASGDVIEVRIFVTQTWLRTDDAWRQASFQATAIK